MDTSTVDKWHYIAGVKNAADLGTRGISFDDVSRSNWIQGPEWLKQPIVLEEDNQHPVEQDMDVHVFIAKDDSHNILNWENFSQFNRLRRTVLWILSWEHKSKPVYELLKEAEDVILKIVNMESCAIERKLLLSGKTISPNSKIVSLVPLIDSSGTLRAKGRLRKADLPYETKHPVILPSKHRAVQLHLNYQHKVFHHEGVEYIRNQVKKKFWIIELRNALRSVRHNCVQCRLFASIEPPQMSDLPIDTPMKNVRPLRTQVLIILDLSK